MRVIFLGWDFPPIKTGGLGTHTYELAKNLGEKGLQILLFIPKEQENLQRCLHNVDISEVKTSPHDPYGSLSYDPYGQFSCEAVDSYSKEIVAETINERFDIIHCHDWMTITAGIRLKLRTRNPLVLTIHSTEYDRTVGLQPSEYILDLENTGIMEADSIITVSRRMRRQLIEKYGADRRKIAVIYNGIDRSLFSGVVDKDHTKKVLFLGRMTEQKGPIFFLRAAVKVLEEDPEALFLVCGGGERLPALIEEAAHLGILDNVTFTGYLSEYNLRYAYEMADVYVMPSVAEPFGITALEAIASGTPVILSKNAGVAEIINHCFKVDYWNIQEIADTILRLLEDPSLGECMRKKAYKEIENLGWDKVAQQTIEIYQQLE